MCSNRTEPTQRLFFALWPDDAVRHALAQSSLELLGRRVKRVPEANLHITLAFAGPVTAPVRDCLMAAAGGIRSDPFELVIDHVGHWPRPRILWAGTSHTPAALWALVEGVNRTFDVCGLQRERRPWQAHVTLARKVSRAPAAVEMAPIRWSISDFSLVESATDPAGSSYRRLATWKLEGD